MESLSYLSKAQGPMAAGSVLTDAVYAFLCGLDAEGARIAEHSLAELVASSELDRPERHRNIEPRMPSVFFDESQRFRNIALARWMVTGSLDPDSMRLALEFTEKSVDAARSIRPRASHLTLDWYMADAVEAGQFERAMRFNEQEERGADKPVPLNRIQSPRRAAYAICKNMLRGEGTMEAMHHVVDRLLARNMPDWLGGGHGAEAARWLKIRYVHLEGGLQPREVLAKAFLYIEATEGT
jgi:hypothetical protein